MEAERLHAWDVTDLPPPLRHAKLGPVLEASSRPCGGQTKGTTPQSTALGVLR